MRASSFAAGVIALFGTTSVASAQASPPTAAGTAFELTPFAGYMIFGDFLKGPLGTNISNAPSPI